MEIALIIGIIAVVIIAAGILIYNGLVQRRLRIDEAFAQVEVQLKRRWDLIPNLVDAVKGYMGFEQQVLTQVTEARANAVAAGAKGPHEQAMAENALSSTLRSLFATVENYPELKANQNVLELQEQLTTTENQISFARQHYNATVLDYNTSVATFPNMLIAGPFGFSKREFFDAEPEASQVPEVDLGFGKDDDDDKPAAPPPQQQGYPQQGMPPQQPPPGYQSQQPPPGYQPQQQGYPQQGMPPQQPPPGYQPQQPPSGYQPQQPGGPPQQPPPGYPPQQPPQQR